MKKTFSVVMIIALLLSAVICLPTTAGTISASAISASEVKSQLDSLKSIATYKPGMSPPTSLYRSGTKGCFGFVDLLCRKIFGHNLASQKSAMELNTTNFSKIGSTLSKSAGNLSETSLKNLFSSAQVGDVVQMDYTTYDSDDSRHTMMVYSVSSSGVVFYHAGSSKIYFGQSGGSQPLWGTTGNTLTWGNLLNCLRGSDDGISLYRSVKVNSSGSSSSSSTPSDSTNPDSYSYPTRSLYYTSPTMKGDDVKWVQAVLCRLGYTVDIDGSYGSNTVSAIKEFQKDEGLTVDGKCGPATRSKLLECWNSEKAGATCKHTVVSATCTVPMHCSTCGVTAGNALGHIYTNACDSSCNRCGATRSVTHSYNEATCTEPKTCTVCKATSGSALGHSYSDATCTASKTCNVCGTTSGSKLNHVYTNACDTSCNRCSASRSVSHNYSTYYDVVHPHKEYKECTVCSEWIYTGMSEKMPSCIECYPQHETESIVVNDTSSKIVSSETPSAKPTSSKPVSSEVTSSEATSSVATSSEAASSKISSSDEIPSVTISSNPTLAFKPTNSSKPTSSEVISSKPASSSVIMSSKEESSEIISSSDRTSEITVSESVSTETVSQIISTDEVSDQVNNTGSENLEKNKKSNGLIFGIFGATVVAVGVVLVLIIRKRKI